MNHAEIKQKHKERIQIYTKFSDKIFLKMAEYGATKTMIILCFILASLPFIFPSLFNFCQYASSGYIQLVYLPIILFAAKISERINEIRQQELISIIKQMHKETQEELRILKKMNQMELQK
jgi:hypothetical protein